MGTTPKVGLWPKIPLKADGMRIDPAGHDVAAAGVDDLSAGRSLEFGSRSHDLSALTQHIAARLPLRRYQGSTFNKQCHDSPPF